MKLYVTDKDKRIEQAENVETAQGLDWAENRIKVYPDVTYQTITGFGGALTESAAYVWSEMTEEMKSQVMDMYFGTNGNCYNFGRTHIQSCDFSLGNRSYVEENDRNLCTFSIKDDYNYQIPMIKAAMNKNPHIQFLASPWSPPAFMKDNHDMNHGGHLLEKYYSMWAQMIARYLMAYRDEGIIIDRITVQNEPMAVQTWDSCIYTAAEEGAFAVKYLRPTLDLYGLSDVKIFIWDHNKDVIVERIEETFKVEGAKNAVDGIAFHWYSGDYFEALDYIGKKYEGKELVFSEGCVEYSRFTANQTANAVMYAHDMIGNFKAGMTGFLDWNILLDSKGGPNHVGNYCDAPMMYDEATQKLDVKLSYYYIGHFSRFVKPGAKRVLASASKKALETAAFVNPDGSCAVIVLNNQKEAMEFWLTIGEKSLKVKLKPYAIATICMD